MVLNLKAPVFSDYQTKLEPEIYSLKGLYAFLK
jgi:hypothetical protein